MARYAHTSRGRRALIACMAIVAVGSLSACTPPTLIAMGTLAGVAIDTYCKGVSAEVKQDLRNAAAGGKQLLCDEGSSK